MRVEHERQHPSAPFWMSCPNERAGRRAPFRAPPAPGSTLRSPSAAPIHKSYLLQYCTSIILLIFTVFQYKL